MFECPFCGGLSGSFLPFGLTSPVLREKAVVGGGYRLNAVCPSCSSLDRERLVYLFLLNHTNIFSSEANVTARCARGEPVSGPQPPSGVRRGGPRATGRHGSSRCHRDPVRRRLL